MLKNNQSGLTIVEILIILVISGFILSMSFFSYKTWQRQILVNNTKDEIKSVLIRAQQSMPMMMKLKSLCDDNINGIPAKSLTGKALNYLDGQ